MIDKLQMEDDDSYTPDPKLIEPWIGFDLDATLAIYEHWLINKDKIGEPIPDILDLLIKLSKKIKVKIMTARVCDPSIREEVVKMVQEWIEKHTGIKDIEVTHEKTYGMRLLIDDRVLRVNANAGTFNDTLADDILSEYLI